MSDGITKRQMTVQEEMDYEMRDEYDLSQAVLNPYPARARARAEAIAAGGGLVVIEPALFARFPSSEAVNDALRSLLKTQAQDAA